jgi:hypothetical protein
MLVSADASTLALIGSVPLPTKMFPSVRVAFPVPPLVTGSRIWTGFEVKVFRQFRKYSLKRENNWLLEPPAILQLYTGRKWMYCTADQPFVRKRHGWLQQ